MNNRITIVLLFFCLPYLSISQIPVPGYKSNNIILLLNATAHLGNGGVIDKSAIAIKDGILIKVEDASSFDQTIEKFQDNNNLNFLYEKT